MHRPGHASVLPDHITPIPAPDSPREAELLVLLLEAGLYPKGLYPKIDSAEPEKTRPDEG
ncbi:hypothetical protein GGP73_003092 [Salinibacter ruber]|nr:hypothetical protein [Salinibacter ruber]